MSTQTKTQKWTSEVGPRITKNFNSLFSKLSWAGRGKKQLTGIIGKPETQNSAVLTELFGSTPLPDAYYTEKAKLEEKYNFVVTPKNRKALEADLIEAIKRLEAARPIEDLRKMPEQVAKETKERNDREAVRKIEQAKKQEENDQARAELVKKFPYLETTNNTKKSGHALVGANIRIILKREFPGQKFTVKTSTFSMGNSCDVAWIDGPTKQEVETHISRFQHGHFDGMEDIYNYRSDVFHVFGSIKYLSCQRTLQKERLEEAAAALEKEIIFDQYDNMDYRRMDEFDRREISEEAREKSYYIKPEKTAPAATTATVPAGSAPQLSENTEKGGLEIRFSEKPTAAVLDNLKSHGWRWSRFNRCWWTKASDNARKFAAELIAECGGMAEPAQNIQKPA